MKAPAVSPIGSIPPRAEQGADRPASATAQAVTDRGVDDAATVADAVVDDARSVARATGAERFPKACRILQRREFLRIQGQGQRVHSRHLVFQFLPGEGPESRLGITVSKKVGNAVVRNRIKRWIREAFRRHPELRPGVASGAPGRAFDLVITAKRDVEGFAWQTLHEQIVHVIGRFLAERATRAGKPGKRGRHPPGAAAAPTTDGARRGSGPGRAR